MHNIQVEKEFYNCRVWLGQALIDFVKHNLFIATGYSIPCVGARDYDEANKVREAVEQGLSKAAVIVSKLST